MATPPPKKQKTETELSPPALEAPPATGAKRGAEDAGDGPKPKIQKTAAAAAAAEHEAKAATAAAETAATAAAKAKAATAAAEAADNMMEKKTGWHCESF